MLVYVQSFVLAKLGLKLRILNVIGVRLCAPHAIFLVPDLFILMNHFHVEKFGAHRFLRSLQRPFFPADLASSCEFNSATSITTRYAINRLEESD